jgi:hypothetical protein
VSLPPAYLTGIAIWSPGFRDARAFVAGMPDSAADDCSAPWVPPRLLRGTSRLTRMLGEVAAAACSHGGADPKTIATIYASGYGEIETMVTLLETIFAGDGKLSPMRFKNSVHNAAAGLGSIGTSNQHFSTALAAGDRSFEAALIETLALLAESGGEAVISVADDRVPTPLSAQCTWEALAVGLCLSAERPEQGAIAVLEDLRQEREPAPFSAHFLGRPLPAALAANPAAHALPLVEAAVQRQVKRVAAAHGVPRPFSIAIRPDARRAFDPA